VAAESGLRQGDVIQKVDGRNVKTAADHLIGTLRPL